MDNYFNLAMEQTLLSSIIFDPSLLQKIKLDPENFYFATHQNIVKAILTLQISNKPIDEDFLANELRRNKVFDEATMLTILSANPTANIEHYLLTIKKLAKKREILQSIINLKQLSEQVEGDELLSAFESTAEKLRNDESLDAFTINSMQDISNEEPEFLCKNWLPIPKKTITLFSAGGGTGKTYAALQIALRYISEKEYTKKVFLWLSEDPAGISKQRAQDICNNVLNDPFHKYINLIDISDSQTFPLMTFKSSGEAIVKPEFYQMKNKLKEYELIIIDPLIGFFTGDENNNAHARQFMQLFTQWAAKEGKTIIFIHHSSKGIRVGNESKTRGASAFVDAVRAVYEFEKIKPKENSDMDTFDESLRRVLLTKDNYGAYKFFGYQQDIKLFPSKPLKVVHYTETKQLPENTKKNRFIKEKAYPSRKSNQALGARIRIVDIPSELEPTPEEQVIIDKKIKAATAAGLKFED
jgi:replicative DNA helicase